jgi:hypothetical protein
MNDVMKVPAPIRLHGKALHAAVAVGVVTLAVALWAGGVDLATEVGLDSTPLNVLSILYKLLSMAGLVYVGRQLRSQSMLLLALLVAMLTVGHFVVGSGVWDDLAYPFATRLARVLPLSPGFLNLSAMFLALAVIGGGLVWAAFRFATPAERPAVVRLIMMLFVVGVFVGPVNAISVLGINREWLFAEDFGQVASLAILTAYVAGLAVVTWETSSRLAPLDNTQGDKWDTPMI